VKALAGRAAAKALDDYMLRRAVGAVGAALLGAQASSSGRTAACASLCTAATRFAHGDETIEEIRARIFGNHIGNGLRSGRKVLRKKLIGDKIAAYYPEPIEAADPMFEDPLNQRCGPRKLPGFPKQAAQSLTQGVVVGRRRLDKLDRLHRRGKGPPKKGQGKRSGKKKK